jgi:hypothetical protein
MATPNKARADRSVSIGGNVRQSTIVTGHSNAITVGDIEISLPAPQNVDILHELVSIRRILENQQTDESNDIIQLLDEAENEATKIEPDRQSIGNALQRVANYAGGAAGFGYLVEKLLPHVRNAVAWLGANWYDILKSIG